MCRRGMGLSIVVCAVFFSSGWREAAAQPARFVDDDSPLGGDGLAWPTAYRYL